jgi:hypothetical protein
MKTASKNGFRSDNALAKQVLEAIARIDQESQQKKLQQLESLQSAKGAILERGAPLRLVREGPANNGMKNATAWAAGSKDAAGRSLRPAT